MLDFVAMRWRSWAPPEVVDIRGWSARSSRFVNDFRFIKLDAPRPKKGARRPPRRKKANSEEKLFSTPCVFFFCALLSVGKQDFSSTSTSTWRRADGITISKKNLLLLCWRFVRGGFKGWKIGEICKLCRININLWNHIKYNYRIFYFLDFLEEKLIFKLKTSKNCKNWLKNNNKFEKYANSLN